MIAHIQAFLVDTSSRLGLPLGAIIGSAGSLAMGAGDGWVERIFSVLLAAFAFGLAVVSMVRNKKDEREKFLEGELRNARDDLRDLRKEFKENRDYHHDKYKLDQAVMSKKDREITALRTILASHGIALPEFPGNGLTPEFPADKKTSQIITA